MKRSGQTIWDEVAAIYDEHTYKGKDGAYPANRYRADRIIDFLKTLPVGSALDAGGGTGYVAARVAELGWTVTYLDASTAMLKVAREKTANRLAGYYHGSVTDMAMLASQSFDVVMMNGVLPYLSVHEEPAAYQEAHRVLKDRGIFIVAQYNQLFDLISLDYFTAQTLAEFTDQPENIVRERLNSVLVSTPSETTRTMKVENPLTYSEKLQKYGFREQQRHYYNFHILPPALETPADNPAREKLELAYHASWQGLILARAFFVIAHKA